MIDKMPKIENEDLRRIFRDFFNDSLLEIEGKDSFVPHAGNDFHCPLCRIEQSAIKNLKSLISKKLIKGGKSK